MTERGEAQWQRGERRNDRGRTGKTDSHVGALRLLGMTRGGRGELTEGRKRSGKQRLERPLAARLVEIFKGGVCAYILRLICGV